MINSILSWIFGKLGGWLLNFAVGLLEKQWPGIKPIIDKILEWLGAQVPPPVIQAHLDAFKHPNI